MLCEGARDFYQPFMRIGFDDIEKIKAEIRSKFLTRYMPVYEKVRIRFCIVLHLIVPANRN